MYTYYIIWLNSMDTCFAYSKTVFNFTKHFKNLFINTFICRYKQNRNNYHETIYHNCKN